MYKLRLMAAAILLNGSDMLMMKRSPNRTLSPGQWGAVGGHLDPSEIADPRAACLREIEEETGLKPDEINGLRLQYIIIRLNGREIRQQFIYVGETTRRSVGPTDEGQLHWIPRDDVLNRDLPFIFRSLLEHWLGLGPSPHVWVGTAGLLPAPGVAWTPLTDPGLS